MKIIPQSIDLMHGGDNDRARQLYLDGVDQKLTYLNINWKYGHLKCYTKTRKYPKASITFYYSDFQYYRRYFSHYARSLGMTVEEYLESLNSTPVEFIFKYDPTVSTETIVALFSNLVSVLESSPECFQGFTRLKVLSWALHADEPLVGPHVHLRMVWVGKKRVKNGKILEYVPFGMSIAVHKYGVGHILSYEACLAPIQNCIDLLHESISNGSSECTLVNNTVHRIYPLGHFISKVLVDSLRDIDSLNIVPVVSDITTVDKIDSDSLALQDRISTKQP